MDSWPDNKIQFQGYLGPYLVLGVVPSIVVSFWDLVSVLDKLTFWFCLDLGPGLMGIAASESCFHKYDGHLTDCSLFLKGSIPEEAPQPVAAPERPAVPATEPTGQPATSGPPVTPTGSSGKEFGCVSCVISGIFSSYNYLVLLEALCMLREETFPFSVTSTWASGFQPFCSVGTMHKALLWTCSYLPGCFLVYSQITPDCI